MKKTLFSLACSLLLLAACNTSNSTETTKEKEEIKVDTTKVADDKSTTDEEADEASELKMDALKYPGSMATAIFLKDGKTLFYYNVDTKKGEISIDGKKYKFDSYKHAINDADYYFKAGKDVTITVDGTEIIAEENPEAGILKGKVETVKIKFGGKEYVYTNEFDVVDGTNAD